MAYKLRFVQTYDKCNEAAFWQWERKFMELEEKTPELKVGKRTIRLPICATHMSSCTV